MADPIEGETVATQDAAEKLSRMLGCQGSHKQGDAWGPCESQEALMVLIRRGAKGYRDWQKRQKKKSACCEGCESKRERVGVHEKARDHDGENKFRTFVDAEERAARLGCEGAHRTSDGMWGPCATAEEYNSIKGSAGFRRMVIDTPTMAKRRRRRVFPQPQRGSWQALIERGPFGVETIPGGGLVSGKAVGPRVGVRRLGRSLRGTARGLRGMIRWNLVMLDTNGYLRCISGGQFTDPIGSNCGKVPGSGRRVIRPHYVPPKALEDLRGLIPKKHVVRVEEADRRERAAFGKFRHLGNPSERLKRMGELPESFEMVRDYRIPVLEHVRRFDGITFDPLDGSRPMNGWGISRKGVGLKVPLSQFFDERGEVTVEGRAVFQSFLAESWVDGQAVRSHDEDSRLLETMVGMWVETVADDNGKETGEQWLYMDITDIFDKEKMTREEAIAVGKERVQVAVADLDKIAANDWNDATPLTGVTEEENEAVGYRVIDIYEAMRRVGLRSDGLGWVDSPNGPVLDVRKVRGRVDEVDWQDVSIFGVGAIDWESDAVRRYVKAVEDAINRFDPDKGPLGGVEGIKERYLKLLELVKEEDFESGDRWYRNAQNKAKELADKAGSELWQTAAVLATLSPGTEWGQNLWQAEWVIELFTTESRGGHADAVIDAELLKVAEEVLLQRVNVQAENRIVGERKSAAKMYRVNFDRLRGRTFGEVFEYVKSLEVGTDEYEEILDALSILVRAESVRFHGEVGVVPKEGGDGLAEVAWTDYLNIRKALSVLINDDPAWANVIGSAHKVRSFFNNIMDPDGTRDATIDVHMGSIGSGKKITSNSKVGSKRVADSIFLTPSSAPLGLRGGYAVFHQGLVLAYQEYLHNLESINARRKAKGHGPLPKLSLPAFQAILWAVHRRNPFGEGLEFSEGAIGLTGVGLT